MAYILQLWIFFGALVSSNALDRRNIGCTEVKIHASLKSEVFLPCHFNENFDNETETVKWSNTSSGVALLTIMENGRIIFESPTEGRVKVFPLLFRDGNFSILIRDLEPSDIGPYFCELRNECWRVEIIQLAENKISRCMGNSFKLNLEEESHNETVDLNSYHHNSWLFFFAGAGLSTLLFVVFNRTGLHNRCMRCMRSSKSCSINEEHHKEHDSSNQLSIQQRAFRTPDLNDATTTTVYVNQA
ncbi:uncharacterized protein LOC127496248 isoform X2 [Ctenopharyngodon idella]|uniref:uncharacterized protein LOC127496248 isoform X2 n=1 Tax=Ctenopharyngodon idella TaxID=7959 RepID=UPI00222E0C51|nr:uncharacterized protein LOC127496248 isoform X2 [Ctenopharyngodon idella]